MQKFTKLSIIMFIIISAVFFAACGKDNNEDNKILVTSVTVSETSQILLLKDDTYTLTPVVLPENATVKTLQYAVQNASVVSVSNEGVITALSAGISNIVVRSTDGSNKQVTVSVRVYNTPVSLSTPSNFRIENSVLKWSSVNNKLSYEIWMDGAPRFETSLTEFPIEDFNEAHNYQVRAKGDEHAIISSAFSGMVIAKVLSVPENFSHMGETFTWDEVPSAQSYEVYINGAIINNALNTSIELDLSVPRTYEIKVRAVTEELNSYSSFYTNSIEVTRLSVPNNVAQQNNGISWDAVSGASAYIVEVNEEEYETSFTNYQLPIDAEAIEYSFRVKAIGATENILESVYSIQYITEKLETPQNLRIQSGVIMWDEVSLAQSYSLDLNGKLIQVGSVTSFSLLEDYLAGIYDIRVIANGNNATLTSSNFSEKLTTNKLSKPLQISVSGGVITWLPVLNATRYIISVDENEYITSETTFSASELESGVDKLLTIKAEAEHYIYSEESAPILIQKLSAPSNFRIENGLLRWDNMNSASSYQIIAGSHTFTTGMINGYYLNLPGGTTYDIKVRSNGDNRKYLNSEYSATISATKLATPYNLSLQDGYITFEQIPFASGYKLRVNGVNYTLSPSDIPYYLEGTSGDTYYIEIMALGDDEYLNSDYTIEQESIEVYQIEKINNIEIENETVTWSEIPGILTYEILLKDYNQENYTREEGYYFTSNTNSFSLSEVASGRYNIKVRAMGTQTTLAGIDSDELLFERLSVPQGFEIERGYLRWENVLNATQYRLEINGEVREILNQQYYVLDDSYDAGQYTLRLSAYGDGVNFISSEWTSAIDTYRMESPQNLRVVDGFVVWDNLVDAELYMVEIGGGSYYSANSVEEPYTDENENGVWDEGEPYEDLNTNGIWDEMMELSTVFNPPFNYADGNQMFYVYAATQKGVLASKKSSIAINKLYAPSNLRVENKIIRWGYSPTETGYRLFINSDEPIDLPVGTLEYDFSAYPGYSVGSFDVYVMTLGDMGDSVGNVVNSNYSSGVSINVMNSPSGLSVEDGRIAWIPQNGASDYELRIYEKVGEDYNLLTIDNPLLTGDVVNYLLSPSYPAGEYAVDIRAIGDNSLFITSEFSSQIFVTKLAAPTNLHLNSGLIEYDGVTNSSGYEVLAVTDGGMLIVNYYLDAGTSTLYELKDISAGENTISVRAKGDNTIYLTSDFTTTIDAEKLPMVQNFRVENGVLKWDPVANASEYILSVAFTEIPLGLVSSYTLPNSLPQDNYELQIKARGTSEYYLNSSYTNSLFATKLNTITNLRIVNGILTWDSVDVDPNGYTVTIIDNDSNQTQEIIAENSSTYILPEEYSAGDYRIFIQTNGNSLNHLNSNRVGDASQNHTVGFPVTKLGIPTNIELSYNEGEYFLTWDAVLNATGYKLVIQKDGQEEIVNTLENTYSLDSIETGIHIVTIQAVGSSITYVNSNASEPMTITRPTKPNNLTVANGMVSWSASEFASEYHIHIVYEGTPRTEVVTNTYYYLSNLGYYAISVQAYYSSNSLPSEETAIVYYEFNLFTLGNGGVDEKIINDNGNGVWDAGEEFIDANGNGVWDAGTPFQVSNETELRNVKYNPTAEYVITNNILLSSANFEPIGTEQKPFIGKLNGLYESSYYIITNLNITTGYTYAGLFGYIGVGGVVENLTLANVNIISPSAIAGAVAGANYGTIKLVTVTGSVAPNLTDANKVLYTGGIVGFNQGIIENAVSQQVTVTPTNLQNLVYGGGIAGYNNGLIYESGVESNTSVTANVAGGVAGYNDGAIIKVYNKGNVTGLAKSVSGNSSHGYAGGIAGYNYNKDNVIITHEDLEVGDFKGGLILNSYNHGNISASSDISASAYAGGIAGYNNYVSDINSGNVRFTYNAGSIVASNSYPGGNSYAGGVVGYNLIASKLTYSYYLNTSAITVTNGTQGQNCGSKTETELRSQDFVNVFNNNYAASDPEKQAWTSVDSNTRATLKWELGE